MIKLGFFYLLLCCYIGKFEEYDRKNLKSKFYMKIMNSGTRKLLSTLVFSLIFEIQFIFYPISSKVCHHTSLKLIHSIVYKT